MSDNAEQNAEKNTEQQDMQRQHHDDQDDHDHDHGDHDHDDHDHDHGEEAAVPDRSQWPKLRGVPIDVSKMPESAWVDETQREYIRIAGLRLAEYGRVYDFDVSEYPGLKRNDALVVEMPEKGLMLAWVSKPPIRIDNSQVKLRLPQVIRAASADDLENQARKESAEKRGMEQTVAAVDRLNLPMSVLRVEYTLDRRKAMVYFAADKRVDFRNLLKDLVHDLKAKVELRQIGARDQTKQIGAIGPCGEETCCSRFLDKFHGVSIKMAKDQGLSLKPTKVSGMCGRLKCCLAYENQVYVEGMKTVPSVGKCVKCKSGGKCGVVRDVDIPRQLVLVEMDDGMMEVVPAAELVESDTLQGRGYRNETMVATTDTDGLQKQIRSEARGYVRAQSGEEKEEDLSALEDENVD